MSQPEHWRRKAVMDMNPGEDLTFYDQFDDCIIGIVERFGMEPSVCYDRENGLQVLMNSGLTGEEAVEWYEYNTLGGWVGDTTPAFLDPIARDINGYNS